MYLLNMCAMKKKFMRNRSCKARVPGQFIRRTLLFSDLLTSEDQGSKTTELLLVHLMDCC